MADDRCQIADVRSGDRSGVSRCCAPRGWEEARMRDGTLWVLHSSFRLEPLAKAGPSPPRVNGGPGTKSQIRNLSVRGRPQPGDLGCELPLRPPIVGAWIRTVLRRFSLRSACCSS